MALEKINARMRHDSDVKTWNSLIDYLQTVEDALEQISDSLSTINDEDGVISFNGNFGLATQLGNVTVDFNANTRVKYRLNGVVYDVPMDTTLTLVDPGDIASSDFGAWRILVDDKGVFTTLFSEASVVARTVEQEALLAIAARAITADRVEVGTLTITHSSAFQAGTTNTDTSGVAIVLVANRGPKKSIGGLIAANGAATKLNAAAATYNYNTIDPVVNGIRLTQIAVDAAKAFDDADTIATLKFGGWLFVTDLAGTDLYALAADGVPTTASAMSYNTAALVQTDLDLVADRLPNSFVPIGQLIINNQSASTWTAATDNLDATSITATFTDATVGTIQRKSAKSTGFDSHQLAHAAIKPISDLSADFLAKS